MTRKKAFSRVFISTLSPSWRAGWPKTYRLEQVTVTVRKVLSRGKPQSDNLLKRLRIELRSEMTIEKTTRHSGKSFLLQKYQNFSYNVDYRFSPYKPL